MKYYHKNSVIISKISKNLRKWLHWLTEQWAGLFTNYLNDKNTEQKIKTMESQIEELKGITIALKKYIEALMEHVIPEDYVRIIENQDEIIRRKKLAKFLANDPLIGFILDDIIVDKKRLKDEEILSRFEKSNNLEEFLKNLDCPNPFPKSEDDSSNNMFKRAKIEYSKI